MFLNIYQSLIDKEIPAFEIMESLNIKGKQLKKCSCIYQKFKN